MSAIIAAIMDCIISTSGGDRPCMKEKPVPISDCRNHPLDEVARDVVRVVLRAEKAGAGLEAELNAIVDPYGWKEYLAETVLEKLGAALQGAHYRLGPAIRDAYKKAWQAANEIEGFVIRHPIMCTIITLGVLVIIAPWVIEVLGFAEAGACRRLVRILVAVHLWRLGAQGIVVFLLSAIGHGVATALTTAERSLVEVTYDDA